MAQTSKLNFVQRTVLDWLAAKPQYGHTDNGTSCILTPKMKGFLMPKVKSFYTTSVLAIGTSLTKTTQRNPVKSTALHKRI